ncbi:MAG: TIGR03084 family protein [Deltaproteobacteria bacterium]|nr:TIGR03084 family protein [Deltaproteobacteria bacterium]
MFQQPLDFRDESEALYGVLAALPDADFGRRTQFKGWTIHDVVSHLHFWNWAADLSLNDPAGFADFVGNALAEMGRGRGIREVETDLLDDRTGRARVEQWREFYLGMTARFLAADPKKRVAWAGPDMSVRSSISARLMETWAHGQEVYDLLGRECAHTDRIKNVADLGVRTFGWAYVNRGRPVPAPAPEVRLTAPSGAVWTWNEGESGNRVTGSAVDFCRVVTQTRNVADTGLRVTGPIAVDWLAIAQCFAGPPQDPPAPGTRFAQ